MRGSVVSLRCSPVGFNNPDGRSERGNPAALLGSTPCRCVRLICRPRCLSNDGVVGSSLLKPGCNVRHFSIKSVVDDDQGCLPGEDEEDDELCPVECVREFYTDEELAEILEKAKKNDALVVVDFYRTSCGSCKYIEQGFSKLCKASGDEEAPVVFLKHNVLDEYDEQSEVAERLRIRTVPLFHFYRNGALLEAFPTRDKERITEAIYRYMSPAPLDA